MKTKFQTIIVLSLFSCSLKSQIVNNDAQTDCQLAMATFENAFMSSCPISKALANEAYYRVYMPCGSGFNLRHKKYDDKFVIDIVWVMDASK